MAEALADADQAIEAGATLGYGGQAAKQAVVAGVQAAMALGDTAKVEALLSMVEEASPGLRSPFLEGQAHRFRAMLHGDAGRYEAAEALFREFRLPFWLAVVQLEHAELLARGGRRDEAAPLLDEARETFEGLRAIPWLERTEAMGAREPVAGA